MLFWFNDFNSYIIWWGYFEDSKQKHLPSRSPLDDEIDPDSWIIDEVNILRFRPSLDRYSLKLKQPVPNSSAQEDHIFFNKIFEQPSISYLTFVKYIY